METFVPKNFKKLPGTFSIARPKGCMAYVKDATTYTSSVAFDPEQAMGMLDCDHPSCPIKGSGFGKATVSGGGSTPQEAKGAMLASAETIVRDHC